MASRRAERERYLFWNYPSLAPMLERLRQAPVPRAGKPQPAEQMVLIPRQESEGQHPRPRHKRKGKGGSELPKLGP